MKQRLLDALRVVLDLAQGNALQPSDRSVQQDEALREHAQRQHEAITELEEFWEGEMNR